MSGGCIGANNHQRLSQADTQVKGNCGQATETTRKNGNRKQTLPFIWHPARKPGEEMRIQI
jgi:hypothetical protein